MERSGLKGDSRQAQGWPVERALGPALEALRGLQKPARGVSLYSTHVNRPAGRRLAALGHVPRMTPNHLTLLGGLCSLAAICLLVLRPPSIALGITVAFVLALGFALDSADGQLARLHQVRSAAGEWLDHTLDCATKLGLHGAVLVAWYNAGIRGPLLLLALAFQFVAVLLFFGGTLTAKLREQSRQVRPGARASSSLSWLLLLPVEHGLFCWSFVLWGWPELFQVSYFVLFVAHIAILVALSVTWFRELS